MEEIVLLKKYFFGYLIDHPFGFVEFLSGFLPLIVSLFFLNTLLKYSKIIFIYVCLIALLEIIGGFIAAFSNNNHNVYLLFYFFETILLSLFYYKALQNKLFKLLLLACLLISLIAIIYNFKDVSPLMNNYSGSIQSISFITISLVCFYNILAKLELGSLKKSVLFWINTGNLIYFSGRFFICLFLIDVLNPKLNGLEGYWYIISILLLIHRIFLAIGISQTKNLTLK